MLYPDSQPPCGCIVPVSISSTASSSSTANIIIPSLITLSFYYCLGLPNPDVATRPGAAAEVFPPRRPTDENQLAGISSGKAPAKQDPVKNSGTDIIQRLLGG